jgi:GT2 family glycosyltransferase
VIREITVVCVSWRDTGDLYDAVASLAQARTRVPEESPRVSLVVVDNGGGVSRAEIESLWPDAVLLVNASNRGLGPASNQAAAAARGDVLLFLNPDTRAEGEPFTPIARAFESDSSVAAVAPRLIEMNGAGSGPSTTMATLTRLAPPGREDQRTFQLRRLPTLSGDARELLLLDHLAPDNPARRRARYADADREVPFAVEQAAGAALAVRRSAFEKIGGFDEAYLPAWYEDVDLCERLRPEGAIRYLPDARFRHRGGESATRLGYDRFLPVFYTNALRYRRARYAVPARAAYRGLLAAGMLLRLAVLPLRRTLPRPRGEAARAYWRVLGLSLGFRRRPPTATEP